MKFLKFVVIIILILSFFPYSYGIRKVKRKTIEELSNPDSVSYVPIPYPKNRNEVIVNLEYAIKKLWAYEGARVTPYTEIMVNLLAPDSKYRIGRVIKVKVQSAYKADDYKWLVLVRDKKNEIVARVIMQADGLWGAGMPTAWAAANCKEDFPNSPRRGPHHLITSRDILNFLPDALDRPVSMADIKKMERVFLYGDLGGSFMPSWEIAFKNNETYYYSEENHSIYKIAHRVPAPEKEGKGRPALKDMIPKEYVGEIPPICMDTLNDELLIFKEVKKLDINF